jgi:uncharacterized damage-inducible protein DinB
MPLMNDLRYPVGKYSFDPSVTAQKRQAWIRQIADTPRAIRAAVAGLTDRQFDTPYRPGGWTIRQVVHHVPDSHLNAYCRFKFGLTEDHPTIKPYDESAWALVADTAKTPPEVSLALLDALHQRWVILLESMDDAQFARTVTHPEHGSISLDWMLQMYAWHGPHHTAHIRGVRERERF